MIAKIKSGKKEYIFVSDRGDIVCNDKNIFTDSSYHVVGEDDTLNDWPSSSDYKPCFHPGFWLDVPSGWKNPWC